METVDFPVIFGSNFLAYVLLFFSSFVLTLILTPPLIKYLTTRGVVDIPGERRVHTQIIPRMGGLIIFSVVLVIILGFYSDLNSIRLIIIGSILIAACGIFDDVNSLNWYIKLIIQGALAVILLLYFFDNSSRLTAFGIYIPQGFNYVIFILFIVGAINSINLMDGLDGLVSGYSLSFLFIIFALAILNGDQVILFLTTTLMGSLLAFLKYNSYPAKIFLGDTGSLVLGFYLVLTSLEISRNYSGDAIDLTFPTLLLAVPILDTMKVFFIRLFDGRNPFHPDKNHLHHVIFGNKVRHKTTVFIIHLFNLTFYLIALHYIFFNSHLITYVMLAVAGLILLNAKQIIQFLSKFTSLSNYVNKLLNIHFTVFETYKKIILELSILVVGFIIVYSFPMTFTLQKSLLVFFGISSILLFTISYLQKKEDMIQNHIFVFINLTVYFLIAGLNAENRLMTLLESSMIYQICIEILVIFVVLFLLARYRMFSNRKIFFSGFDLILIVFITLSFIINSFISHKYLMVLSVSFLLSFLIYLWYRILVELKGPFTKVVYYASFALPLFPIIYSFFI